MAYEIPGMILPMEAGASLASDQFKLVTLATDGQVDVTGGASTNLPIGILQNKPSAAGQAASVMVSGVSKGICGVTLDEGNLVTASEVIDGRLDVAGTSTDVIIGMALEAGDAGEIVAIYLFGGPGGEKR